MLASFSFKVLWRPAAISNSYSDSSPPLPYSLFSNHESRPLIPLPLTSPPSPSPLFVVSYIDGVGAVLVFLLLLTSLRYPSGGPSCSPLFHGSFFHSRFATVFRQNVGLRCYRLPFLFLFSLYLFSSRICSERDILYPKSKSRSCSGGASWTSSRHGMV